MRIGGDRERAVVMDRAAFDRKLMENAQDAGAELVTGRRVQSLSGGQPWVLDIGDREITTRLVIGADGARSSVRNWLDLLEESGELAELALRRIVEMARENGFEASALERLYNGLRLEHPIVEIDGSKKTPVYDILQIHSISGVVQ